MIRVVATDLYAALAQASGLEFTPTNVHGRCLEYDTDSGSAHLRFLFDPSGALLAIHAEQAPLFCDCPTPDEVAEETASTLAALRQSAALGEALALTNDPEEVALLRQVLALLRRRREVG